MSNNLITPDAVVQLAYITSIDVKLIKDEIIITAQNTYIKPVLGEVLYEEVIANQSHYPTLINDFIMPCLAFYTKYLMYSQQVFETASYSSPDPLKASELIDPAIAVADIHTNMHSMIIKDILFIARQKEQALIDHLKYHPPVLFIAPTKKRISGFLLSS